MVEFFFLVEGEVRCSDRERLGWSTIGIGERNSEAKKKESERVSRVYYYWNFHY